MADKNAKNEFNIPGAFYVDDQCIACDACVVEAPNFFKMNDEEGTAFVYKQPSSEVETKECLEALDACPVDAIGKDGEA